VTAKAGLRSWRKNFAFLGCGWLAGGFARFRCTGCGVDRLSHFRARAAALSELRRPPRPIAPRLRYRLRWRE